MELDLDTLGVVATRALHIAALAVLLGTQVVAGWIAPAEPCRQLRLRAVARGALAAALLTGGLWLLSQSADMADAMPSPTILGEVLQSTTFGQALSARVGLVLIVALLLRDTRATPRRHARLTAPLSAVAVATLAATGHGNAGDDAGLTLALIVHVLAASIWLGGLPSLWIVLRGDSAAVAARRFSWLGLGCVALLIAGAIGQASLIGSWAALVGTAYGQVISVKLTLLLLLLFLAAANLRTSLNLPDAAPTGALRVLRRRVLVEMALGVCAIGAASWLLQLAPAAHDEVTWPFAWRPSMLAFQTPELRPELLGAVAMLLIGGVAGVGAARMRSGRLPLLAVAAALVMWALPSFALLLVPAYPTSFYRSPTGFSAASVLLGSRLYPVYCAGCHGAGGGGDGPLAARSEIPPANLMAPHLWAHGDGELFWWLSDGMRDPEGALVMPGFAPVLGDDARWALIDFIRARNAGLVLPAAGVTAAWVERRIQALGLRARTHTIGGIHVHHAS